MSNLPSPQELTFNVVKSDGGKWVCEFMLNGQMQYFTGEDPTDAVGKAVDFLGANNVRSAEIVML